MSALLWGLLLFLGVHSVRIVADGWRSRQLQAWGVQRWKLGYTLVSLLGFGLLVWGFAQARQAPLPLWTPPLWTRHLAGLLMLPAAVLLTAAYVPGNALRARLGHPMLAGTALWALAHLLANGHLAELLLFGAFGLWSLLAWRAAAARDRVAPQPPAARRSGATAIAVAGGLLIWAALVGGGHRLLFGVSPFGWGL